MTTPRKRAHRGEIPGTVQTVQDGGVSGISSVWGGGRFRPSRGH